MKKSNSLVKRPFAKRAVLLCLLLVLCLGLSACGDNMATAKEPVTAVATAPEVPVINDTTVFNGKTLREYYNLNVDTIGWLKIDGIKTDHVVMLGQDKAYENGPDGGNHYLSYNFNHVPSSAGELYIDQRCQITPTYLSQNITVYGHHMADGTMLAGLDYYVKQDYCKEHPYITFNTLWEEYTYQVFGVFVVNLKVASDAAFDYRQPEYGEQFDTFIKEVKERSYYDTGVEVTAEDRIITLSTCTYPTGNPSTDNARLVVMGKLVENQG